MTILCIPQRLPVETGKFVPPRGRTNGTPRSYFAAVRVCISVSRAREVEFVTQ